MIRWMAVLIEFFYHLSVMNSLKLQMKTHKEKQTEIKFWDVCAYYAYIISTIYLCFSKGNTPLHEAVELGPSGSQVISVLLE